MNNLDNIWDQIPAKAIGIAMDKNQSWYWFVEQPEIDDVFCCWIPANRKWYGSLGLIYPTPEAVTDWRESYTPRPEQCNG